MPSGLTKKHSTMVQGIAILLMLYHHFFLNPEAVPGISYGNLSLTMHTAWFGKLCVGLFCFVSGYGMYHVCTRCNHRTLKTFLVEAFSTCLSRIGRLFIRLWAVILVVKGLTLFFQGSFFDQRELLLNMFAINLTYNGSWWFVRLYAVMLLVLPFLDLFFTSFTTRKETILKWLALISLSTLVAGLFCYGALHSPESRYILFMVKSSLPPVFLLIFSIGYLFARFAIYERIDHRLCGLSNAITFAFSLFSLFLVITLRVILTREASFATLDFIFVPVFIYGLIPLLNHSRSLSAFLGFFGRISTYLWLTHVLIYDITVDPLADLFRPYGGMPSTLFYLTQLLLSGAIAFLFTALETSFSHVVSSIKPHKRV